LHLFEEISLVQEICQRPNPILANPFSSGV
jgi:hypothetical protein